jgi:hypothetical protein
MTTAAPRGWISRQLLQFGGTLAAALLSAAAARADLTAWTFSAAELGYVDNTGGTQWQSYAFGPTVGGTAVPDGLHIVGTGTNGNVFQLTEATYVPSPVQDSFYRGNILVLSGTGAIDGAAWQHPDDFIRTTFGIGFELSGGTLTVYRADTGFTLYDASNQFLIGVGSGFADPNGLGSYGPGGYGVGWAFEDRFGSNYQTATHFSWTVTFGFDWTGMAPGDTFNFAIPGNSIDLQVVPEPASLAAVLAIGSLLLVRRRA